MAHIENKGYPQHVVGESHYIKNLRRCYNDKSAERIDSKSIAIPVLLKLDNDNKFDSNAVAVISPHGMIGYLPAEDAEYYRELYGEDTEHTTMCKVLTHTGEVFGAYLSITMTEKTANRILAKNLPNREIFSANQTALPKKGFFARLFGR